MSGFIRILHGDCLAVVPSLGVNRFHACVTDPPYHLTTDKRGGSGSASLNLNSPAGRSRIGTGFMGKAWDGGDVAFRPETWKIVLDGLRPGAFLVAFASTRGYHRMVCAIEDAGFIIHPMLGWLFGTGFPKATRFQDPELEGWRYGLQALKPAMEPICLAQKPMIGTGTENWKAWGCGGLNINGCRVPTNEGPQERKGESTSEARYTEKGSTNFAATPGARRPLIVARRNKQSDLDRVAYGTGLAGSAAAGTTTLGRWPANILHDGSDEVLAAFPDSKGQAGYVGPEQGAGQSVMVWGDYGARPPTFPPNDSGSAARFFYCAKATKEDRAGSSHPTVKPTALMEWLVRLVTPPGGVVLDPFAGTGSTLLAAKRLGFDAIGIEREADYVADAERKAL